jgi:hypothetical protein
LLLIKSVLTKMEILLLAALMMGKYVHSRMIMNAFYCKSFLSHSLSESGFPVRMLYNIDGIIYRGHDCPISNDLIIWIVHHLMSLKQWVCGFAFPLGLGCLHFVLFCDCNALQRSDLRKDNACLDDDLKCFLVRRPLSKLHWWWFTGTF